MVDDQHAHLLQKQKEFFTRKNLSRHLIDTLSGQIYNSPLSPYSRYLPRGKIIPQLIRPEAYRDSYEWLIDRSRLKTGVCVSWIAPLMGFPWMEAILGCPIFCSDDGMNVWAEPIAEYVKHMERFDPQSSNPWLEKLSEFTEYLVKMAKDSIPVNILIMRGVADFLSAMMGPETMSLELYDHPDKVKKWAKCLSELWTRVIKAQLEVIPEFRGYYWSMGLGFSQECAVFQEDAAALLSPEMYERIIFPSDKEIFDAFPYTIMHLHSSSLHILDLLLDAKGPSVIQIGVDPGSSIQELIPIFAKVQQHKPLYLSLVNSSAEEIQKVIDSLPATGMILGIPIDLLARLTGVDPIYEDRERRHTCEDNSD